jgi:PEP-CTERM motif
MGISGFRGLVLGSAALLVCSVSALATSVDYNLSVNPAKVPNNPNIQNSGNGSSATTGLNGVVYGSTPYLLPIYGVTTNTAPNLNVFNSSTSSWGSGTWSPTSIGNTNLYGKQEGGGETGLGVVADPLGENEEFQNNSPGAGNPHYGFLILNIANVKSIPNLNYFQLAIGSAQGGELFTIWGSNNSSCSGAGTSSASCSSAGSATLLYSGGGNAGAVNGPFDVPNWQNYNYIWVGAAINPTSSNTQSNILLDADISFSSTPAGTPEPATLALAGSSLIGLAFYLRKRSAKR